jgi:hypothetical protein
MYCPECGNDAGDAKFCPECGANLAGVQDALRGKTTGGQGGGRPDAAAAAPAAPAKGRGLSPAVIWGGFGVVAVIVIVIVVMVSGGFGSSSPGGAAAASTAATPVMGVTTGTYADLVKKANEFYDKGDAAFQNQDFNQGSAYFQAAAMTYAAAWEKQKSDPGVGTDFATSLFYSGNIDAALSQIQAVIKAFPDYQAAYYNLGNYLAHKSRIADQQGDKKTAKADNAGAKAAYTKAVALDPKSAIGKQADASLQQLK